MREKKGQILSLDLMSSIILFTLLVVLFVGFFVASRIFEAPKDYDFEIDYVFNNMNINLNDPSINNGFLSGSRVNTLELSAFAQEYNGESIDSIVMGTVGETKGIGLYPEGFDVCLYFTDIDETIYDMDTGTDSNIYYLGMLKSGTCNAVLQVDDTPCEEYRDVISIFKPVLLDFGDYRKNRVVQINVVICKV
jgi:hypothetical protein